MADNPETKLTNNSDSGLPTAAIICISVGAYVVVVVIVLIIRQALLSRGLCRDAGCWCFGKEGEETCVCCVSCSETCCNCKSPSIEACLDSICPARRKTDCADIIMCQCCQDAETGCCSGQEPLCDCGNCDCRCNCQPPECDNVNCCCFTINLRQPTGMEGPGGMQGQMQGTGTWPTGTMGGTGQWGGGSGPYGGTMGTGQWGGGTGQYGGTMGTGQWGESGRWQQGGATDMPWGGGPGRSLPMPAGQPVPARAHQPPGGAPY